MPKYILQQGKFFGFVNADPTRERRRYVVGDAVELTNAQAESFGDKFKAVAIVETEAKIASDAAKAANTTLEAEKDNLRKELEAEIRAEIRKELEGESSTETVKPESESSIPTKDAKKAAPKVGNSSKTV